MAGEVSLSRTDDPDDPDDPDADRPEPAHDHELEVLEDDPDVPPRPEEEIADAGDA